MSNTPTSATTNPATAGRFCDQCGLPYSSGGTSALRGGIFYHFCCYGCSLTHAIVGEKGEAGSAGLFLARLGFAAFLSMNIMALSWVVYDRQWIAFGLEPGALLSLEKLLFILATPVMLLVGFPFARVAIHELRAVMFSMDSLIALGSFTAYAFSSYEVFRGGRGIYFDTATMTLVLVTAGRYVEATAKVRTSDALRKLLRLQPDRTRVIVKRSATFVPSGEVAAGELFRVLAGERIPLDGTIVEGSTFVDEAVLTGESLPINKRTGDPVYAATMNQDGAIVVRVTATQRETVYAQTVRLVEEAQRTRSPIQQKVDRISALFVPFVAVVAGATFAIWATMIPIESALVHGLTVLVVACPCALGIGTPLAAAVSLTKSAETGILVRSTRVFETLAQAKFLVFDKTGTLTQGVPKVVAVRADNGAKNALKVLAGLERESNHAIAETLRTHFDRRGIRPVRTRNVRSIAGSGVTGKVWYEERWVAAAAGNADLMWRLGFRRRNIGRERINTSPSSVLFVGWEGRVRGEVQLQDEVRPEASGVVGRLDRMAIAVSLLSGDTETVTNSVATQLGITDARGGLKPADKVKVIRALKTSGPTVMVGDGINDAPSLAAADVGIALGSATDIAKESADVTILGDHLGKIPWLLSYSRLTLRTIRQNLAWAFAYNGVGIGLAVCGALQPPIAALAMVASSITIILNSHRLAKSGPPVAQ